MLEELMNIIKQHGQQAVVENNEVPDEHNNAVMQEAGSSIFGGLQSIISGGNLSQITSMLQGGGDNGVVSSLTRNFAENIAQKCGINPASASNIAGGLIPKVLGTLTSKANDPNDSSIDLKGILGSLTGGNTSNLAGMASSIGGKLGMDKDGDGDVDLGDITKMFGK